VTRCCQLTVSVAKLIIEFAKQGKRDPVPLAQPSVKDCTPRLRYAAIHCEIFAPSLLRV
jgi:hypothetical protein